MRFRKYDELDRVREFLEKILITFIVTLVLLVLVSFTTNMLSD